MNLPAPLAKIVSYLEAFAFIAAAVIGATAGGRVDSSLGHWAVLAGAIGAALHGLIHDPQPASSTTTPPKG